MSTAGGSIIVDNHDNQVYCGLRSVNVDRYNRDYFINTTDTRMSRANQEISFSPQDNVEFRQVKLDFNIIKTTMVKSDLVTLTL